MIRTYLPYLGWKGNGKGKPITRYVGWLRWRVLSLPRWFGALDIGEEDSHV